MEAVFTCLTIAYCLLVMRFHYLWLQIPVFRLRSDFSPESGKRKISVIIPVRNEALHIISLLKDLQHQRLPDGSPFPSEEWEVIVVDDDSEDETVELVQAFQSIASYSLHLISSDHQFLAYSPKKRALWQGIKKALGEIIITTDGDCRVGPYWLSTWGQFFQEHRPALVAGGVTFRDESSWFQQLQTIEFASLIGIGAASIQGKMPVTCNGANLAFTRSVFLEVKGYEGHWHIPSGDDEFLLHAVFRRFPNRVYFLKSQEAIVRTQAKRRVVDFFQQRKRWAGKWKMHREGTVVTLALLVFGYQLACLIVGTASLIGAFSGYWLGCMLLLKIGLEWAFLKSVLNFLKKELNLLNFLGLQLLYSAYFVMIGVISTVSGYTWKNRKYKKHDGSGIRCDG